MTVGANASSDLLLDQIPGMQAVASPFRGFLRIEGASVATTSLKQTLTESGETLITPIPAIPESAPLGSSQTTFLYSVTGGGYTTQLININ
jgi:hypothetical protein